MGEDKDTIEHKIDKASLFSLVVHPADVTCPECGKEPQKKRGRPKKDEQADSNNP